MSPKERLLEIQDKINAAAKRSGRKGSDVTLVAVSKTFPIEDVVSFARLGQVDFGENKIQEFVQKTKDYVDFPGAPPIRWHVIGHLQRNKAKELVGKTHLFHALDSVRLAETLHAQLKESQHTLRCLIQVNVSGEDSKFGLQPSELDSFVDHISAFPTIKIGGLMTLAAPSENLETIRPQFALLRSLSESVQDRLDFTNAPELSMGMSSDFELAIEEGATIVRVGSSLFGERS
ncbi:MAG: YggS family pyridoxal phosphate-dependent enzyme [Bacteroidetes bacterium]|nr:YggS family pyridoxal phosphate-dependent enzyme [Bacteroidota bacterium]